MTYTETVKPTTEEAIKLAHKQLSLYFKEVDKRGRLHGFMPYKLA